MDTIKAFEALENAKDVWECDTLGDIWAINYDRAADVLDQAGVKDVDSMIEFVADYYGIDVD